LKDNVGSVPLPDFADGNRATNEHNSDPNVKAKQIRTGLLTKATTATTKTVRSPTPTKAVFLANLNNNINGTLQHCQQWAI